VDSASVDVEQCFAQPEDGSCLDTCLAELNKLPKPCVSRLPLWRWP
jgi:hypothetical protein